MTVYTHLTEQDVRAFSNNELKEDVNADVWCDKGNEGLLDAGYPHWVLFLVVIVGCSHLMLLLDIPGHLMLTTTLNQNKSMLKGIL